VVKKKEANEYRTPGTAKNTRKSGLESKMDEFKGKKSIMTENSPTNCQACKRDRAEKGGA